MSQQCTVCGRRLEGGQMGNIQHFKKHRRQFREKYGRDPKDNDEVRQYICPEYDSEKHVSQWRDKDQPDTDSSDFDRSEEPLTEFGTKEVSSADG